jgi:O-methyltransferase
MSLCFCAGISSSIFSDGVNVMSVLKSAINLSLAKLGFEVRRKLNTSVAFPVEFSQEERALVQRIKETGLTMASYQRLFATALACKHVGEQGIKGDFVECGVWRGGNSILAASIWSPLESQRSVFLFDTFSGMTRPSEYDVKISSKQEGVATVSPVETNDGSAWCFASIEDVRANLMAFGIDPNMVRLVRGDVCETLDITENLPERISVLRLDTDWYESTKKELDVLYPRLVSGGILIVDDYGHWAGSKRAVDEYFARMRHRPFFQFTDYTGRCAVKP